MSRSGDIALDLGGEERTFRLGIGQWRKVQEKCDAGPAELLARLAAPFIAMSRGMTPDQMMVSGLLGSWRVDDVREVILQGLLGAGVDIRSATQIVKDWVEERPLLESVGVAYQVVLASVIGTDDERPAAPGEPAPAGVSPNSPAGSSGSEKAASTRKARPSVGTPAPSTP